MYRGMKYRDASVHRCIVPGLVFGDVAMTNIRRYACLSSVGQWDDGMTVRQ